MYVFLQILVERCEDVKKCIDEAIKILGGP